jgi:alkanesulfonate monooxygenase SsuD/methylene tetrahydromethanopterin reductase-like flavin-dependent oxidoreductase (luciferase family)
MKFQLAINMERVAPDVDMRDVERHTLEMVQMADDGGFEIAWAAEHHALEMTIAPGPFQILTWWAAHTSRIRLGPAVVVAPYWHPIRLAGEAALLDLYSGGRLEFGIGSGAYQREFDRMRPCGMAIMSTTASSGPSRRRRRCPSPCKNPTRRSGSQRVRRLPTTTR